ncbi:MAG TPA: hypothetical protein DER60_10245 [Syntrophomonas sp.]|nr:hypothetical protein [Syntrophomonas sp.]
MNHGLAGMVFRHSFCGGLRRNNIREDTSHHYCSVWRRIAAGITFLVLWFSAIASAFIDNIPFVATFIPLIKEIGIIGHMSVEPLWWALSLGACLGGNGTIIGASANVIVSGIAERHGCPITFLGYMKIAFPLMLLSVVIASLYLWAFFL